MSFRQDDDQLESVRNSSTHTIVLIEDQITIKYKIMCFSGKKSMIFFLKCANVSFTINSRTKTPKIILCI